MTPTLLVDSSVLLDVFENDAKWFEWSVSQLETWSEHAVLAINPVIYAEVSIGFQRIEEVEDRIHSFGLKLLPLPREALFLAGKVFIAYRRRGGARSSPLPDFFIGAQAAAMELRLLTRDAGKIRTYFPRVELICPH